MTITLITLIGHQEVSRSKYWELTDLGSPHEELSYFQNILPSNRFFCASDHKHFLWKCSYLCAGIYVVNIFVFGCCLLT